MNRKTILAAAVAAFGLMGLASTAQAVPAVVATTPGYGGTPVYNVPNIQPGYGGAPVYNAPNVQGGGYTVYGTGQTIFVQPAPPAPMYEAIPAPRHGHTWSPGFYRWQGNNYAWSPGYWIENREGHAWLQPQWQRRADGSWFLAGGDWVPVQNMSAYEQQRRWSNDGRRGPNGDLDRDGIVNRDDGDRDGDGVPNHRDAFPSDPTRW